MFISGLIRNGSVSIEFLFVIFGFEFIVKSGLGVVELYFLLKQQTIRELFEL